MTWSGDLRAALLTQKLVMSFVGIWPVKSRDYFMDLRWTVAALTQLTPLTAHFTEFYLHCHGIKQSFDSVTPGCAAIMALVRLIAPLIYREELFRVVSTVIDDWSSTQKVRDLEIMRTYLRMSVRVTKFLMALVTMIIGVYTYLAISIAVFGKHGNDHSQTPNDTLFEENPSDSCIFHSMLMKKLFVILQATQIFFTSALTMGTTSFFFTLVMHLCGQFDVLGDRFSNSPEDARTMITGAIKRHCHLIELVKCLNDSFRMCLLVYIFITGTLLCIEGFLLISALNDRQPSEIVHHTIVSLLMLIQLSFYTFAGDYLQARSLNFSHSVYGYDWYNLPPSICKDLQILLLRAGIPHRLTAGKIMPMNMVTMKDVLKSTASYLSVLRVLLDE